MAQLISNAANSGYNEFDTLIPSLTETADIVEAFRLYHYGKANYTDGSAPATDSIHSHLKALEDAITAVQNEVEGGIALAPLLFMGG